MPAPNEITSQQLLKRICAPDAPLILDLRIDEDFADDPRQLPASIRIAHSNEQGLREAAKERQVVIYCQKGRKISQGAAALINAHGGRALVLMGGQVAWAEAGFPMMRTPNHIGQTTRWVTRARPKVDRIACPWLIRRFINAEAEFLFVPPQDVDLVAQKFDAIAFDTEEAAFTHQGELCSFDALLSGFGLRSPALDHMATIIRAADTNQLSASPQAEGLLALLLGLSRRYKDDQAQLVAGLEICDALYFWARDGVDETHEWPHPKSGANKKGVI